MSLEDQIKNHYDEVVKGRNKKTVSNMNKFRKFLYKNQNKDFTERERTRLFQIVQLYFTQLNREEQHQNPSDEDEEGTKPSALELIEDALKMPASMFNQKQKSSIIKWYDEILGKQSTKPKEKKPWEQDEEEEYPEQYDDEDNENT